MKLFILGKTWDVRTYRKSKFEKKHPGTVGVCLAWKKQIRLLRKNLSKETIAHELTHAYFDELCVGDPTRYKKKDMEEKYCELMAKFGDVLLKQVDEIWLAHRKGSV